MLDLAQRLATVHPNAKTKVRNTAKYVSKGLQEFYIVQDAAGFWRVKMYNNPGYVSSKLAGAFTSEQAAERVLINHLKSGDKFGKAIYPQNV
jgi:hypothetical protein